MPDLVQDLLQYLNASPTPYHAVEETVRRLRAAGYEELDEVHAWRVQPEQKVYVVRGGSIAAFHVGRAAEPESGFLLIGAHTDSPNLRIKPNPEMHTAGCEQLGVEPYGGVLLHTWLDRDLSLAGRVSLDDGTARLVDFGEPLLRVPSLAIHLNRKVNQEGLKLNAQKHMAPVVALTSDGRTPLREMLAGALDGVLPSQVLGWDLMTYDVQGALLSGQRNEFIHSGRIDNLASCHAAINALLASNDAGDKTRGVVLYDHEEVGSRSAAGAASNFLRGCLERLSGSNAEAYHRALADSWLVSADMAHAVHPNYADRHEPRHQPTLGGGPVIKINVNQSYATDSETWALFERLARDVDVKTQRFVVRSDLGCGSTIGPITSAELGIKTVDVGNPMLSMHSCREMCAATDVPAMVAVMTAFFAS